MAREDAASLVLRPLEEGDEELLVEGLLGWHSVPAQLREALFERAEGNPFFLEQLVGGLIDSGALSHDANGWRVISALTNSLPDTIHGVLAARIDRLSGQEKFVLQEAAVVGRMFWPAAVRLSVEDSVLRPALDGLEAKGFVLARTSSSLAGEREYIFKHALVHDVGYAGIPLARRARSHARVASWLEGLTGRGDEGVVELVANHYRAATLGDGSDLAWTNDPAGRAEVRERAFIALIAAGAAARQRNVTQRGLELHQAALELAVNDGERAIAYEELGDDHGWSYHGDPSVEAWTTALELRRALDDDDSCARICLKAARHCALYWGGFANRPSGEMVDRLVDEGLTRTHDQPLTRAWLLALRALASGSYTGLGRADPLPRESRIAAAEEATAIAAQIKNGDVQTLATRCLGGLYLQAGRPDRSLELAEHELAMIDSVVAIRDRLVYTTFVMARLMDIGGDFERALALARDTREQSTHESAHERMHATYFVMAALYRLGRWSEIPPLVAEHLAAFTEETVDMNCPYTRGGPAVGALVLERLGNEDAAREAQSRIVPNDNQPGIVEAWMAERELLTGRPDKAREIAERTLAFGRGPSIEEPPYELAVLVEALAALADWTALAAVMPVARARAGYLAWLPPAIERAEAARLDAAGDSEGARVALDRALETYMRLGMNAEVTTTRQRLASLTARTT
jgi:tetratricopeptide (TPR) repeat protein